MAYDPGGVVDAAVPEVVHVKLGRAAAVPKDMTKPVGRDDLVIVTVFGLTVDVLTTRMIGFGLITLPCWTLTKLGVMTKLKLNGGGSTGGMKALSVIVRRTTMSPGMR